jgi:2-oxoglutarate ferredoxin oxidoreductase subunit gamma
MDERYRLVFSGAGGQGVITASIVLAKAAVFYEGWNAVQTQSYGPEARGGSTRSDLILSPAEINYPKVLQPNILVCLTQEAYDRYAEILRPGGLLLSERASVRQRPSLDARQMEFPFHHTVVDRLGTALPQNLCLLGALQAITRIVKEESLRQATAAHFGGEAEKAEINLRALALGRELAAGHSWG